ncbi:integrase catalytic domain-containing protein [Nephila pilipes]|uniref:Integrase catalytic domain-containing protein n=1 Tax=Nephila pilipes TaxID=299642 RepID=A0A8X6NYU7_NEPPI|nr:integrase catalytic domain-containing protein [Nephila pilipes]
MATLLAFRLSKIAITCGVSQAFLQLILSNEDRDTTRFFWCKTMYTADGKLCIEDEIVIYRFTCLLFGLTSNPFLLSVFLCELATMYKQTYPTASKYIMYNTYMNDFVMGTSAHTEATILYQEMQQLTSHISLPLAKWTTNSKILQDMWKQENVEFKNITQVLGVNLDTDRDVFQIDVQVKIVRASKEPVTKRLLLKLISKVYDPLGLFAPVTVIEKILFQDTWLSRIQWDELLPPSIAQQWYRTTEILLYTTPAQRLHYPGTDNPADHLTRDTFPSQLSALESWWHGPNWLTQNPEIWPTNDLSSHTQPLVEVELRKTEFQFFYVATVEPIIDTFRYSSCTKFLRMVAWILCFVRNCKSQPHIPHEFNCNDIENAKEYCIQTAQYQCFPDEINALKAGRPLQTKSEISCFNPCLKDGYLRFEVFNYLKFLQILNTLYYWLETTPLSSFRSSIPTYISII